MKLLSVAAILVHIWTRVASHKFKDRETMIETASQKPRIAIMIVGVLLKVTPQGVQVSYAERPGAVKHLIEMMSGEDVEESERRPAFDPGIWPDVGSANVWENTKSRLITHLSRFAQVDTYVCVNDASGILGDSDGDVKQIFEFTANGQLDRAAQCVSKIKETGQKYEWFIKTRPDFFSLQDWPDVTKFNPDYIYTRFRVVAGIKGLTSHVLSGEYCKPTCPNVPLFAPPGIHGYINDDMLLVASWKLIDHVFAPQQPAQFLPAAHLADFVDPVGPEGDFTKQLIANHILTMPLSLAGCPLKCKNADVHCTGSYKCRNSPVPLSCGNDAIAVGELHNRMLHK